MAFESIISKLIPEGAVMAGQRPKTIIDNGDPGYHDTSGLANMARALEELQIRMKMKQEEQMKKQQNRADMYKTLRAAGYAPNKAYEAVISDGFPNEAGGTSDKENESAAKVDQIKANTGLIEAKTKQIQTRSNVQVKQQILEKVAAGEELTPGQQKIYDDTIKHNGNESSLAAIMEAKRKAAAATEKGDLVPMFDPVGKKKLVPKSNVEAAKKKGWKLR